MMFPQLKGHPPEMRRVKIVGGGQLGSRHLQALKAVKQPLQIEVVEPNADNRQVALDRFKAAPGNDFHELTLSPAISSQEEVCDFVIIATNAKERLGVLTEVLSRWSVKGLLLEKLLFTDEGSFEKAGKLIKEAKVDAWVNCPMRQQTYLRHIQQTVSSTAKQRDTLELELLVSGSRLGLVTSSIHYLDYLCFLCGGSTDFTLNLDGLDAKIIDSKRKGYHELTGSISALHVSGARALLTSFEQGDSPFLVQINTPTDRFVVRENENKSFVSRSPGWTWTTEASPFQFQSQLTTATVESYLDGEELLLTKWQESFAIHLRLLAPIRDWMVTRGIKTNLQFPFT